jgi:hypothetical protein
VGLGVVKPGEVILWAISTWLERAGDRTSIATTVIIVVKNNTNSARIRLKNKLNFGMDEVMQINQVYYGLDRSGIVES